VKIKLNPKDLRPSKVITNPTVKDAARVLAVVDHGLCRGVGAPIPGQMCVEAAVCYALGEEHGDGPNCVDPDLRQFKICLNDAPGWENDKDRARGLRRISIIQLSTYGVFEFEEFSTELLSLIEQGARREAEAQRLAALANRLQPLEKLLKEVKKGTAELLADLQLEMQRLALEIEYEEGPFDSVASTIDSGDPGEVVNALLEFTGNTSAGLHRAAEMAVQAIRTSHPKLKSIKWMDKLAPLSPTKKAKLLKLKKR
jgi:hypothetical protein